MSLSTTSHEEPKDGKISNVRKRVLALVESMIKVLDDIVHRIGGLEAEKDVKSMQLVVIFQQINDFYESKLPCVLRYQVQIKAELHGIYKQLDEINKEREMIIKTMAKLSTFLKDSSLSHHPFLDTFETNLDLLIEKEKKVGSQTSKVYQNLCKMKAEYLDVVRKENNNTTAMVEMDPERIIDLIDELCKLKHFGKRFSLVVVYSKGSLPIDSSSQFQPIPKPSPKSSKFRQSKHRQSNNKPKLSLKKSFTNLISKLCNL